MFSHESVLVEEALRYLEPGSGSLFVDGTVGLGGHAEAMLRGFSAQARLIALDRDGAALERARERLSAYGDRVMWIHDDFRNIGDHLKARRAEADAVLLDLGLSSMQLDDPARGFSFSKEGPLDMRMDARSPQTAADLIERMPVKEFENLLYRLGEERYARRIAASVDRARHSGRPIRTTRQLAAAIFSAVPASYRHGRIHPATRTFQAIRMKVNGELESLEYFLSQANALLREGGRLVVITFHSLEDRMVKHAFRAWAAEGLGDVLTRKAVRPSDEEVSRNPRSRSAKLRAYRKGAVR